MVSSELQDPEDHPVCEACEVLQVNKDDEAIKVIKDQLAIKVDPVKSVSLVSQVPTATTALKVAVVLLNLWSFPSLNTVKLPNQFSAQPALTSSGTVSVFSTLSATTTTTAKILA
jgi:hypothetical protein